MTTSTRATSETTRRSASSCTCHRASCPCSSIPISTARSFPILPRARTGTRSGGYLGASVTALALAGIFGRRHRRLADLSPRLDCSRTRRFGQPLRTASRVEPHSAGERRGLLALHSRQHRTRRHRARRLWTQRCGSERASSLARRRRGGSHRSSARGPRDHGEQRQPWRRIAGPVRLYQAALDAIPFVSLALLIVAMLLLRGRGRTLVAWPRWSSVSRCSSSPLRWPSPRRR